MPKVQHAGWPVNRENQGKCGSLKLPVLKPEKAYEFRWQTGIKCTSNLYKFKDPLTGLLSSMIIILILIPLLKIPVTTIHHVLRAWWFLAFALTWAQVKFLLILLIDARKEKGLPRIEPPSLIKLLSGPFLGLYTNFLNLNETCCWRTDRSPMMIDWSFEFPIYTLK